MLVELLIKLSTAASGFFLTVFVIHAASEALRIRKNYAKFRKQLRGIQFAKGHLIFGGHMYRYGNNPRNWLNIIDDFRQYGQSFACMFGKWPCVITTDLNLIKRVAIDEADIHTDRMNEFGLPVEEFEVDNVLLTSGDQWRRLRRNISPAFSSYKIRAPSVRQEMMDSADKFISAIESKLSTEKAETGRDSIIVDGEDVSHRYILDVVFTCLYKQSNQINFFSKYERWQQITEQGVRALSKFVITLVLVFPILRGLIRFYLLHLDPYGQTRSTLMSFIRQQTADRRQQVQGSSEGSNTLNNYEGNLMDYVIDRYHEKRMTTREFYHSAFLLFFAANKTTTDGLSKLMYLIAKHPDIQSKLRASILKDGIESEYLNWCIFEALRLFPPVGAGATRMLAADITTPEDVFIPKGTIIFTSAYSIHKLPEYWGDDSEQFKPERWADSKSFHPTQFLAFGAGKRNCLGKDFALQSIKLVAERLLLEYRFEYVSGPNDAMLFSAPFFIFCSFHGPTHLRISRV